MTGVQTCALPISHQAGNTSAIARSVAVSAIPPLVAGTGTGTSTDPYIIGTLQQLDDMRNNLGWYYELANDIDATPTADVNVYPNGWIPIDTGGNFTGSLNGNGFVIEDRKSVV